MDRGKTIHTKKWKRTVKAIKKKGGARNPYAVATKVLGKKKSILKAHRKK